MKNPQWLSNLETVISGLELSEDRNDFKGSLVFPISEGSDSERTFLETFGRSKWQLLKSFRFQREKTNVSLMLPNDAIIFFRKKKEGIIAASSGKKLALKIFLKEPYKSLLNEETETLERFSTTTFADFVPKVLRKGDGWVVTTFCSNERALSTQKNPERYLLHEFPRLVLPALTELYKSSSAKKVSLQSWAESARLRAAHHPSKEKLFDLIGIIIKSGLSDDFLSSRIHHDLHAGNILVGNTGSVFIDWEGMVEGLVLIDFYDFLRRVKDVSSNEKQDFLNLYVAWMKKEFTISLTPEVVDLFPLIYSVERSLILFEKRGVDRMSDQNGFELKTWHQFCS